MLYYHQNINSSIMSIIPIVKSENKSLRAPCDDVDLATPVDQGLIDDMNDTMKDLSGVGIAAPQIGVNKKIALITQSIKHSTSTRPAGNRETIVIINPVLKYISEDTNTEEEGCLSIPGIFGPVERATEVEVEFFALDGTKQTLKASGFDARVIQHEINHLNSILFVDHIDDPSLLHS